MAILNLSRYLINKCTLWVWDFDDTIIDTSSYLLHSMEECNITNLTDLELQKDIPYYIYFRDTIQYLYSKGHKFGIASFGVYTIIQAYMNRIFGFNQKYFDINNIKAFRHNVGINVHKKIPKNKNGMIYELMQFYKISSFENVCLFDDAPSNIADALAIGIYGIQIDSLFNPNIMLEIDKKYDINNKRSIFYSNGQRKLWKHIPYIEDTIYKCNPDITYKTNNISIPTIETEKHNSTSEYDYRHKNKKPYPENLKIEQFKCEDIENKNCNSPLMKTINIIILLGLIIALIIIILRIYNTNDIFVTFAWFMILTFVVITLILTYVQLQIRTIA